MKAAIKELMSFDVDNLAAWRPPQDFGLHLRILAGPSESEGAESFDLVVCTGGWLAAQAAVAGPMNGRHHLIVTGYDWERISRYVHEIVERCEGANWQEVGEQLARIGYWEFEDYRE